MSNWRGVWEDRRAKLEAGRRATSLDDLLILDGFDGGLRQMATEDFRAYADDFGSWAGLVEGESVYEVGCGAGAFLMALEDRWRVYVSGSDFATNQVEAARAALPHGSFEVATGDEIPVEPGVDVTVSNGVFHYFASLDVARRVLDRMARKARRAVSVLDVPDVSRHDESEADRRAGLPEGEYERLYAGLPHLYYPHAFFEEFARDAHMDIAVRTSFLPGYGNAPYRFSVLMTHRS